jgi:hypothetical protein
MPEGVYPNPANEVDVGITIYIGKITAPAMMHGNTRPQGEALQTRGKVSLFSGNDLLRSRTWNSGFKIDVTH